MVCSICNANCVNKSTCPYNKEAKFINKKKHNNITNDIKLYNITIDNLCNYIDISNNKKLKNYGIKKKYICLILKNNIRIYEIKNMNNLLINIIYDGEKEKLNKKKIKKKFNK